MIYVKGCTIPLTFDRHFRPHINLKVGNREIDISVDTGSTLNHLNLQDYVSAGYKINGARKTNIPGLNAFVVHTELKGSNGFAMPFKFYIKKHSANIVGLAFLRRYHCTLDLSETTPMLIIPKGYHFPEIGYKDSYWMSLSVNDTRFKACIDTGGIRSYLSSEGAKKCRISRVPCEPIFFNYSFDPTSKDKVHKVTERSTDIKFKGTWLSGTVTPYCCEEYFCDLNIGADALLGKKLTPRPTFSQAVKRFFRKKT